MSYLQKQQRLLYNIPIVPIKKLLLMHEKLLVFKNFRNAAKHIILMLYSLAQSDKFFIIQKPESQSTYISNSDLAISSNFNREKFTSGDHGHYNG